MVREICLNWNNHTSIVNEFRDFLSTGTMVDVTLACDGKSLKAHKAILSACSPFFKSLLSENPCKHPIIMFQDVKYAELRALIDFMYDGEVNVPEDHLAATIKAAKAFKVKILGEVTLANDESEFQLPEGNPSDPPQSSVDSKVQSDDDSEPRSGGVSAIQSEDESESQSDTESRTQPELQSDTASVSQMDDESEISLIQPSTALSVATLKHKKGTPQKRSRDEQSDSEISEPETGPSTKVLSGDKTTPTAKLCDSRTTMKSPSTKSPHKSPQKENIDSPPMPVLGKMLCDESDMMLQSSPVSSRKMHHQTKLNHSSKEQQQSISDYSSKEQNSVDHSEKKKPQSSPDCLDKKRHKVGLDLSSEHCQSNHPSEKLIMIDIGHADKEKLQSSHNLNSSSKEQHQNNSDHSNKKKNQISIDHSKKGKHFDSSEHSNKKKHKSGSDHSNKEQLQSQNDLVDSSDEDSEEEEPQSSPDHSTLASRRLTPTSTMPIVPCEKLRQEVESNIIMEYSSKEHHHSSPDHSEKEQNENGLVCLESKKEISTPNHLQAETQADQTNSSDSEPEKQKRKKRKCRKVAKRPYVRLDEFLDNAAENEDNYDPDFAMYKIEKTPDGLKMVYCLKCDFKTRYTTSFKRHAIAKHTNLKKFKCERCSYATTLDQHLKRHVREVHERIRRFHCTLCSYQSAQRQQLKRHVASVHEHKQPFVCKLCGLRSSQKASVQQHIKAVHEQRRDYTCSLCSYRCAQPQNLKRHVKLMHEDIIYCIKTEIVHQDSDPDDNN